MPSTNDLDRITKALLHLNPRAAWNRDQSRTLYAHAWNIRHYTEKECNRELTGSEKRALKDHYLKANEALSPFGCVLGQHYGLNVNIAKPSSTPGKDTPDIIMEAIDCL